MNYNEGSETVIVLALTPSYVVPSYVVLNSLLRSTKCCNVINVICLVSKQLPVKIEEQFIRNYQSRLKVTFINMEEADLDIYINEKYTIAAYYRLLLPDLLSAIDKVIYIDADVVVRQDLVHLYKTLDMTNYYLAGVYEPTLAFQEEYVKSIGCESGKYFNSGFLVMNLKKMREDGMVQKFLKSAENDQLQFPDQDVLNQLCKDDFLPLSPVYNGIRTFFIEEYKNAFLKYYSEEDWQMVQNTATVHYTGAKPWNSFTIMFDLWWDEYLRLPNDVRKLLNIKWSILLLGRLSNIGVGKRIMDYIVKLKRWMVLN